MALVCVVCGSKLPTAAKRRVIHPSSESNADVHEFFVRVVAPGYTFDSTSVCYVCRSPCFSDLERAMKHHVALQSLLDKLRTNLDVPEINTPPRPLSVSANPGGECSQALSSAKQSELGPVQLAMPKCLETTSESELESVSTGSELGTGDGPVVEDKGVKRPCTHLKKPSVYKRRKVVELKLNTPLKRTKLKTPPSHLKIFHMKGRRIVRKYLIHSPYKPVVKSTRYKKPTYTVRTLFKSPTLRDATLQEVINVVGRECETMCALTPSPSILRSSTIQSLKEIQWESVINDLKAHAPVLLSILTAAASRRIGNATQSPSSIVGMAASILLKSRSKNMCKLQAMVGALLYAGHASKRVYTRLNKLGVYLSHKAVTRIVKRMGDNHDRPLRVWQASVSESDHGSRIPYVYIIVGDNIDKRVTPRTMRVDNQVRSLHYFHAFAALSRVETLHLDDTKPLGDVNDIPLSTFLLSPEDCLVLRDNYVILISRILVQHIEFLQPFKKCVPKHIEHPYSEAMRKKSTVVPVGVIPKNENITEEMIQVMETLQDYTPSHGIGDENLRHILFCGDYLTIERARGCQEARINSDTIKEALLGLEPAIADWHAEANFLQTIFTRLYKSGSSMEGGTLLQLRNLINRRNISGKFNAAIDFFELVLTGYVLAAALHYFGLSSLKGIPANNVICPSTNKEDSWCTLKRVSQKIVDKYVMVNELFVDTSGDSKMRQVKKSVQVENEDSNPHVARISKEHNYCVPGESVKAHKKRRLPDWMVDDRAVSLSVHKKAPDGVFNYSSAVLNDGLLLLELRDAVHEGDGQ